MTVPLTGGCACGAVRYTIAGAPKFAFICQCRACQQMTGSDHAAGFGLDAENLTITGALKHFERTAASGHAVRTYFCAHCSAPVYNDPERAVGLVMVHIGSLDDPSAVTPDRIFYPEKNRLGLYRHCGAEMTRTI